MKHSMCENETSIKKHSDLIVYKFFYLGKTDYYQRQNFFQSLAILSWQILEYFSVISTPLLPRIIVVTKETFEEN